MSHLIASIYGSLNVARPLYNTSRLHRYSGSLPQDEALSQEVCAVTVANEDLLHSPLFALDIDNQQQRITMSFPRMTRLHAIFFGLPRFLWLVGRRESKRSRALLTQTTCNRLERGPPNTFFCTPWTGPASSVGLRLELHLIHLMPTSAPTNTPIAAVRGHLRMASMSLPYYISMMTTC